MTHLAPMGPPPSLLAAHAQPHGPEAREEGMTLVRSWFLLPDLTTKEDWVQPSPPSTQASPQHSAWPAGAGLPDGGGSAGPVLSRGLPRLRALPGGHLHRRAGLVAQAREEPNSRFGTRSRLGRAETWHCQGGMDLKPQL